MLRHGPGPGGRDVWARIFGRLASVDLENFRSVFPIRGVLREYGNSIRNARIHPSPLSVIVSKSVRLDNSLSPTFAGFFTNVHENDVSAEILNGSFGRLEMAYVIGSSENNLCLFQRTLNQFWCIGLSVRKLIEGPRISLENRLAVGFGFRRSVRHHVIVLVMPEEVLFCDTTAAGADMWSSMMERNEVMTDAAGVEFNGRIHWRSSADWVNILSFNLETQATETVVRDWVAEPLSWTLSVIRGKLTVTDCYKEAAVISCLNENGNWMRRCVLVWPDRDHPRCLQPLMILAGSALLCLRDHTHLVWYNEDGTMEGYIPQLVCAMFAFTWNGRSSRAWSLYRE